MYEMKGLITCISGLVMYCVTSVFILCTCILIVVNAILAAVLKQVVLFVLYIEDGQDLGADLIMGIHYPVVHVFSKRQC